MNTENLTKTQYTVTLIDWTTDNIERHGYTTI